MAQFGRALRSGRRGRWFESSRIDFFMLAGNLGFIRFPAIFIFEHSLRSAEIDEKWLISIKEFYKTERVNFSQSPQIITHL